MTREEAIQHFKEQLDIFGGEHAEAIKVAIEALQNKSRPFGDCSKCIHTYGTLGCCTTVSNEWVYDCEHGMEQYKSTKAEPSDDGTLEVKVEDATKVGRVLISDDEHRGGLYYPDEDEPQGISFENDTKIKSCSKDSDLISRAEAIEALGEEPPVWCDEEYEIAERDQWRADTEAIKSVPSAEAPRPIDPTITVDLESGVVPRSACEPRGPKTIIYADRIYSERPKGRWHYSDGKPATIGQSFGVICDQCGAESEYCTNFCGECGADMRGEG